MPKVNVPSRVSSWIVVGDPENDCGGPTCEFYAVAPNSGAETCGGFTWGFGGIWDTENLKVMDSFAFVRFCDPMIVHAVFRLAQQKRAASLVIACRPFFMGEVVHTIIEPTPIVHGRIGCT